MIPPPAGASATDGFETAVTVGMKRRGVRGRLARVRLVGGMLRIDGAEGSGIAIAVTSIGRIRVGYFESRHGNLFGTRLWLDDGGPPIALRPIRPFGGYRDIVLDLARAVAGTRGLQAVHRGTGLVAAVYNALVFGAAFVGLSYTAWKYWEAWLWPLLLLPIAFGGVTVYAARQMLRRHLPRPVASLAELDVQLPRAKETR